MKIITSRPAILGVSIDNIRARIADLGERRLRQAGEDDHIEPGDLELAIDNISGKIVDLHRLRFANPVKMITSHPATVDTGISRRWPGFNGA